MKVINSEKIVKTDSKEYRLTMEFHVSYNVMDCLRIGIETRQIGKRKWLKFIDIDSYEYRKLESAQREAYILQRAHDEIPDFNSCVNDLKKDICEKVMKIDDIIIKNY